MAVGKRTEDDMADGSGAVIITQTKQYEMLLEVRDEVKHLSSVLDPAITNVREDVSDLRRALDEHKQDATGHLEKHDRRISVLERRTLIAIGIATVLGLAGGPILAFLLSRL